MKVFKNCIYNTRKKRRNKQKWKIKVIRLADFDKVIELLSKLT